MSENNKWSIDSWSALQSAATLLMMAVAGLVWGLKLENRIDLIASAHNADKDKIDSRIANLELATQKGILPVTEARLHSLENRVDVISRDVDACLNRKR